MVVPSRGVGATPHARPAQPIHIWVASVADEVASRLGLREQMSRAPKETAEALSASDSTRMCPPSLGPACFWGILETRPYMRARQGLAAALWHLGEREAALGHLRDLLRLNPGDNQGLRYTLATWHLATRDDAALADLLGQYPDEGSATWAYTRAMAAFRRHGAGGPADAALREALTTNPFVPAYLLGRKPLPRRLPASVGFGDEDEAVAYTPRRRRSPGWRRRSPWRGWRPWSRAIPRRQRPPGRAVHAASSRHQPPLQHQEWRRAEFPDTYLQSAIA